MTPNLTEGTRFWDTGLGSPTIHDVGATFAAPCTFRHRRRDQDGKIPPLNKDLVRCDSRRTYRHLRKGIK
jgi:hypothetical protein